MTLDDFFRRSRNEISNFNNGRTETSAFIIWYLINYFRLDKQEAIDCVCDQQNDKGIDGIFVDDEEEIIYLIQSKYSPIDNQMQGDGDIRNFIGAKTWFSSSETIQELLDSSASKELKSLILSNKLLQKDDYEVKLVFITNKKFNAHANEFISINTDLEAWDCELLLSKYTFFADDEIIFPEVDLYLTNKSHIDYNILEHLNAKVFSIPAKQLIKLEGIQDRTLFYKNVRYGVGNTRVNKSIKKNITNDEEHENFFLYHNGITIVCNKLTVEEREEDLIIKISNYGVINGCQSLLTLYENREKLTKNLNLLVKVIEIDTSSNLVDDITYFANNQNSISLKDLRSNDSAQRSLQKEFRSLFGNKVGYARKRGEDVKSKITIDKDLTAQLISSFYLNKPQNTHLKQQLFGDNYSDLFNRKINAEKIFLSYIVYDIIKSNVHLLTDIRIRNYGLALFFFTNSINQILREDNLGKAIIEDPKNYVTNEVDKFKNAILKLWELITPDINYEIEEYANRNDNYFDYKNVFKNTEFVNDMSRRLVNDYIRLTRRNGSDKFESIFNNL
ncbi:AIPR family protein [Empedobacter stercoris]|uniref:AIPR family protein n=1 Tax=Empedobacter stercoris TaxID=1628248 RepID=UPI001CE1BCFE|nr:AIPR family protein [Empedobacter stercoris]MCA4776093.1 AIPR family protein [Empedobacter stercoris]